MVRKIGSGRLQEGGELTVYKHDFNHHVEGEDFRHDAEMIDMAPPLVSLPNATTVQETLEQLSGAISSAGSGFITIGDIDGYAQGNYNVGSGITLPQAFASAQADVRLQNGGIILLMAGTYRTTTTIQLNQGISVMGEIGGTLISGESNEQPIFKILKSNKLLGIGSRVSQEVQSDGALDHGRLFNLTLVDNLDGYVTSGGLPISTMQSVPMVLIETGAHITFEEVRFIGRVHNSGVSPARYKTKCAIGTINTVSQGTHLACKRCYFDAMEIGIDFAPDDGNLDYLLVTQCRARTWGREEDPTVTDLARQCFIAMSLCNFTITDNIHSGVEVNGWGSDGFNPECGPGLPICSFGYACVNGICVFNPE